MEEDIFYCDPVKEMCKCLHDIELDEEDLLIENEELPKNWIDY